MLVLSKALAFESYIKGEDGEYVLLHRLLWFRFSIICLRKPQP